MAVANNSLDDIQDYAVDDISNSENSLNPAFSQKSREKQDSDISSQDLDTASSIPESSCPNDNSKKVKRASSSDTSDCLSSPNRVYSLTSKKCRRNYRPRIVESSSDEEMNSLQDDADTNSAEPEASSHSNNQDQVPNAVSEINVNGDNCDKIDKECTNHIPATSSVCNENPPDVSTKSQEADQSAAVSSHTEEASTVAAASPSEAEARSESQPTERRRRRRFFLNSNSEDSLDEDDDDDDDDDDDNEEEVRRARKSEEQELRKKKFEETINKQLNGIKGKTKPKHNWNGFHEIWRRQYGTSANRQAPVLFSNRYYDSLSVALRLELHTKLEYHTGCVNALNFDSTGQFLASGSDDVLIVVWDWCKPGKFHHFDSGHKNNVFQTKFLSLSGSTHIVSCARDGQVRLAEYSNLGEWKTTRRLAKHTRAAHKITAKLHSPYEVLSSGEDGAVISMDIRTDRPQKIVHVKDRNGDRVPLYSIHGHPLNDQQFCISGQDEYVRVYDTRILSPFGPPAIKYCPAALIDRKPRPTITCAVYSNNGDAIIASYNDEDIFLFDTSLSEGAEPIHRYSGHRTGSTVKGVNFFGPSSRIVVSGSDCGNIFFWDRETEAIVNCLKGDDTGVVNVLEPHPSFPVLATSGLDNDVKIWTPTAQEDKTPNEDLWKTVKYNLKHRYNDIDDDNFTLNSHMLMMVFQEFRGRYAWRNYRTRSSSAAARGRPTAAEEGNDDVVVFDMSDSSSEANDSDDSDVERGVQCATH